MVSVLNEFQTGWKVKVDTQGGFFNGLLFDIFDISQIAKDQVALPGLGLEQWMRPLILFFNVLSFWLSSFS